MLADGSAAPTEARVERLDGEQLPADAEARTAPCVPQLQRHGVEL